MSDSEVEANGSSGIKIPRFHGRRGEDYGLWRLRLRAACRVKGVWGVVGSSSTSSSSTTTTTTTTDQESPPSARDISKMEKASGIIISALGDSPLRVVLEADDDPKRMLKLLDARYASNRTVSRIAVQTQLFRMRYTDQAMSTYVDKYTSLFSQLEQMGKDAAIPESHKAPMLLASIDPKGPLESTAAALRTKEASELTWEYVATTLIDEYNAKQSSIISSGRCSESDSKRKKKGRNSTDSGKRHGQNHNDSSDSEGNSSDIETTARALAAALKSVRSSSVNSNLFCDFCEKKGHTEDRCWQNLENPDNKLPVKLKQQYTALKVGGAGSGATNGSRKKGKVDIISTIVEKTTISPPADHRSYADSGATVHCFHTLEAFVPGSLKPCPRSTVLLANKSSVETNQCGEVILPFENANVRLRRVLYIPKLGYNLVSTGRLADNGIESHFCRTNVRLVLEENRFFVGSGDRNSKSRMYMLPEPMSHSITFCKIGGAEIERDHSDCAQKYISSENSLGGGNKNKPFSQLHTPELNGVAERVYRAIPGRDAESYAYKTGHGNYVLRDSVTDSNCKESIAVPLDANEGRGTGGSHTDDDGNARDLEEANSNAGKIKNALNVCDKGRTNIDTHYEDVLSEAYRELKIPVKSIDDKMWPYILYIRFCIWKFQDVLFDNQLLFPIMPFQLFDLKKKSRRSVEEDRHLLTSRNYQLHIIDRRTHETKNKRLSGTFALSGKQRRSVEGWSLHPQAYQGLQKFTGSDVCLSHVACLQLCT